MRSRYSRSDPTEKFLPRVIQIDITLVGEHPDSALVRQADHCRQILRTHDRARGIRRRIQNDDLGPRRNQPRDHLCRDPETLRLIRLQQYALAAGIAYDVLERNPVGNRQNHFVAVIDEHLNWR